MSTESHALTPRTSRFLAAASAFFVILVAGYLAVGIPAAIVFPAAFCQSLVAGAILIRHPGMSSFPSGREAAVDVFKMLALGLVLCGLMAAVLYLVLQYTS